MSLRTNTECYNKTMRKILITTSSFGKQEVSPLELLKSKGLEYVLNPYGRKLTEEELISLVLQHRPDYVIAGTEKMSAWALDAMKPCVKLISRCGVGMDGIDLEYAKQIGIKIMNTPDAPTAAVAELTLGITLDLLRGISKVDRNIRNTRFDKSMGNLLFGKTVGLIGCGRIGSYLAKLLQVIGCQVIGYDSCLSQHPTIKLKPFLEVVEEADILTLHIPYTESNHHLIDKKTLDFMKPTAYLINASRGGLVDEGDLYEAIKEGRIAGAGLDCYEKEPYDGKLRELDNVVLTPHIGSYAAEARCKQEMDAVENILQNL